MKELTLETQSEEANRLGQKPVKEVDLVNQPGSSLLQAQKDPSSDPKTIADLQKAADGKYLVKGPGKIIETPTVSEIPDQKLKLDSAVSKTELPKISNSIETNRSTQTQEPRLSKWEEVDSKVESLGNKAKLFEKLSNRAIVTSGTSAIIAVSSAVLTGSVAGGVALVPLAASIALPLIVGSGGVAVLAMGAGLLLKFLKGRSRNKAYDLARNKYSDTD